MRTLCWQLAKKKGVNWQTSAAGATELSGQQDDRTSGQLGDAVLRKLHDNAFSSSSRWKSHTHTHIRRGTCKHRTSRSGSQKSIEATEPWTKCPKTQSQTWRMKSEFEDYLSHIKKYFHNWKLELGSNKISIKNRYFMLGIRDSYLKSTNLHLHSLQKYRSWISLSAAIVPVSVVPAAADETAFHLLTVAVLLLAVLQLITSFCYETCGWSCYGRWCT